MTGSGHLPRHRAPAEPVGALVVRGVRALAGDALYRGSFLLLANVAILAVFGFVFWAIAARAYPAADVGVFSVVTSTAVLLGAVAAVGIPNMLLRDLNRSTDQRLLVGVSLAAVTGIGGGVAALAAWLLGQFAAFGPQLNTDSGQLLVLALVVVTSVGGVVDAGLVALRRQHVILVKSAVGSVAKVAALPAMAGLGSVGLFAAYTVGAGLSIVIGAIGLARTVRRSRAGGRGATRTALLRRGRFSAVNYLGTLFGIVPSTVVPMLVLSLRGPAEAAWLSVAVLLAGFLNVIPSATAQVLFAEAGHDRRLRVLFGKATRGVYALLIPAAVLLGAVAHPLLQLFGADYAARATGCLRWLVVGSLVSGMNYLFDSAIIASGRAGWYVVVNAANALLVVVGVLVAVPYGLAAVAIGWTAAQTVSVGVGAAVLVAAGLAVRRHDEVAAGRAPRTVGPHRGPVAAERVLVKP